MDHDPHLDRRNRSKQILKTVVKYAFDENWRKQYQRCEDFSN